jgi:hypothetical protein
LLADRREPVVVEPQAVARSRVEPCARLVEVGAIRGEDGFCPRDDQ